MKKTIATRKVFKAAQCSAQVTLPQEVRDALNIDIGDFIMFIVYNDNSVIIKKVDE